MSMWKLQEREMMKNQNFRGCVTALLIQCLERWIIDSVEGNSLLARAFLDVGAITPIMDLSQSPAIEAEYEVAKQFFS